jgi:hypothetical protein
MARAFIRSILLATVGVAALTAPCTAETNVVSASPPVIWRYNMPNHTLPFPRSDRAESVWASGVCWDECGSHCTWGVAACLTRDAQGHCLKLGDACDRYCQRECRTMGGPFVPDLLDSFE